MSDHSDTANSPTSSTLTGQALVTSTRLCQALEEIRSSNEAGYAQLEAAMLEGRSSLKKWDRQLLTPSALFSEPSKAHLKATKISEEAHKCTYLLKLGQEYPFGPLATVIVSRGHATGTTADACLLLPENDSRIRESEVGRAVPLWLLKDEDAQLEGWLSKVLSECEEVSFV